MADSAAVALDTQMRAVIAEREALDEWAWRLAEAKREASLRFDAETRALHLEREALDTRAQHLVEIEAMRREIEDSRARQALQNTRALHSHAEDFEQDLHLWNGVKEQNVKKRKASSCLEPASSKKKQPKKPVSGDQTPKKTKKKKTSQGKNKTPSSKVSEWWCAVCRLDCQNSNALASHFSGKKHRSMLKKLNEEHGSADWKNLLEMGSFMPTPGMREPSKEKPASFLRTSETWCEICQIDCQHAASLASHQSGKKHLKRVLMESNKEAEGLVSEQEINASPVREEEMICTDNRVNADWGSSNRQKLH